MELSSTSPSAASMLDQKTTNKSNGSMFKVRLAYHGQAPYIEGMSKPPSSPHEMLLGTSETLARWWITVSSTPELAVGTVEAPDADSAIREAIKYYGITNPEHQKRLAARRIS
jgi:hypothetical protein